MNKELQDSLATMSFAKFKAWYEKHADLLPMFYNPRWLDAQANPVRVVYDTMLVWCRKFPL
jgi:hypothetical protein